MHDTFIETICQHCGATYQCPRARYNVAKSYGTKLYCSRDCARMGARARDNSNFFKRQPYPPLTERQ